MKRDTVSTPVQGVSKPQTVTHFRNSEDAMTRRLLRSAWNTAYAQGTVNGFQRATSEFKAVNNIGDFLNRQHYACNIPTPTQPDRVQWRSRIGSVMNTCDGTGIPCSNTNTKFVADSSDYIRYRKQRAFNQQYNASK